MRTGKRIKTCARGEEKYETRGFKRMSWEGRKQEVSRYKWLTL